MLVPKRCCTTYIDEYGSHYIMFVNRAERFDPDVVYAIYTFRDDHLTECMIFNDRTTAEDYARGMSKPFDLKEFDYLYERLNWYLSRKTCRMYVTKYGKHCVAYITMSLPRGQRIHSEPTIYVYDGKYLTKHIECSTFEWAKEFLTGMCKNHSFDEGEYNGLLALLDEHVWRSWKSRYGKLVSN